MKKGKFEKLVRVAWILADNRGCVLARGNPGMKLALLPYHLNNLTDNLPALVSAETKQALAGIRREWNDQLRKYTVPAKCRSDLLVYERKVRITIEEA